MYHEVPLTVWELQDRALAELGTAAQREGLDLNAVFDKAAGRSRGPLQLQEAKRALKEACRRFKAPEDELDVLFKRYEIVNRDGTRSADTKTLVDDLCLGKAPQPGLGAGATP